MADAGESFAIIGGEGFVGAAIIHALRTAYPSVPIASFGLTQRTFTPEHRFFRTDITSPQAIAASLAASGANTVFHTASPHHDADLALCEKVNIGGTKAVIEGCWEAGVKKLVFTSTVTVVHEGQELINIDERLPRTESRHDPYVLTKAEAERLVLDANGKQGLKTCSLRLAGIIGPGDRQLVPNFVKVYNEGQSCFQIGSNTNLFDFVDVRNVARAHVLAAAALSAPPTPPSTFATRLSPIHASVPFRPVPTSLHLNPTETPNPHQDPPLPAQRNRFNQFYGLSADEQGQGVAVAGEAFFITNGEPMPFWSLAQKVWYEYTGKERPFVVKIGKTVGFGLGWLSEMWAGIVGTRIQDVGLTRHRVGYVTDHMYFDIEKARRVLGYEPEVSLDESIRETVRWFKDDAAKAAARQAEAKAK